MMAEVGCHERTRTLVGQYLHLHRGFFIGRRMRDGIRKIAGQPVDRRLAGVHRHVKLFALHAIGDQRPHAHLAIARASSTGVPLSMPRSLANSSETSTQVSGVFSWMPATRPVRLPS